MLQKYIINKLINESLEKQDHLSVIIKMLVNHNNRIINISIFKE